MQQIQQSSWLAIFFSVNKQLVVSTQKTLTVAVVVNLYSTQTW